MVKGTILIVDDNKSLLTALEVVLKNEFDKVITTTSPNRINEILRKNDVDVVMLDMNYQAGVHSGNEGLFWMREIFRFDSSISVIIVTAYGDVELAVKAIQEGAVDFILKPWENSKLLATVNAAWQLRLS